MCNPYQDWLGLPNGRQSFSACELLGVAVDETNPVAFEEAALRRLDQLRPYQLKYPQECSRLLNEIAAALNTLRPELVPASKVTVVAHDTTLDINPATKVPESPGRQGKPGRLKMLVLCHGDASNTGSDLSVWQMRVEQVPLTERQRRKLQGEVVKDKTCPPGTVRARVLARVGSGVSGRAVVALVQKGLGIVKRAERCV